MLEDVISKPVQSLTFRDIEGLTSSGEPESVVLDYKGLITGSEHDKKELAKDVSAFANSQGGLLLIGVDEKSGKPVHPPTGINRMLGAQKVEEWVDQVVVSNIAPRVPVTMNVIDHADDAAKCLVAVQVPISPRAPHMVTVQGDNRYYRRYFTRHQYHSQPAEEYEVRELFHRSSRMRAEVQDFLRERGLDDPRSGTYGRNQFTAKLSERQINEGGGSSLSQASSHVIFTACPEVLSPRAIPVMSEEYWDWIEPNNRKYPPLGLVVPFQASRPVSRGSLHTGIERENGMQLWGSYLYLHDSGFVEMGLSLSNVFKGIRAFPLVPIVARYWQFLRFVADLYRQYSMLWPFDLAVHLTNTQKAVLHHLGKGWAEPFDSFAEYRPECLEANVVVSRTIAGSDVPDEVMETVPHEIDSEINFAFGCREARAFGHPKHDPDQRLDVSRVPSL